MSKTTFEIQQQPDAWQRAALDGAAAELPGGGSSMLLIGCGTSAFVAQSMARLRDLAGVGPTEWAYASELPASRRYEQLVAITRSGTTTEIEQALESEALASATSTCVTAVPDAAVPMSCDHVVGLPYADEESVVQTRFPTSVLAWWRAVLGEDLEPVIGDARSALDAELPQELSDFEQFVFLGRGWTVGLAHEAALKVRECAQAWAESYPALDYRHGPIAVAGKRTLVVSLGGVDDVLLEDVRATGAEVLDHDLDPLGRLVVCQRIAVSLAAQRGLDPDHPHNLSRSVILKPTEEVR